MKVLFDFFPLVIFFIAFKIKGILFATGAAIVTTALQVIWSMWKHKKVDTMLWINFAVIALLGGLTLAFQNKLFIQYKPTVLYWIISLALLISHLCFKKNLIANLLQSKGIDLPTHVWGQLNVAWSIFFFILGIANIYVVKFYTEGQWLDFKVFGTTFIIFCFVILQSIWLSKHLKK